MPWTQLTDVRCYYEICGQGEPLLLVAGLGSTLRTWDPILPELSRRFSVICFDNRGTGRSVAQRPAHHLSHLVSDCVELLDCLQIERTHVMGLSLGGIIAHRLAADHPGRADRLVLASCTDRFSPYLRQVALLLAHALRQFSPATFIRTVELLGSSPKFIDEHADEIERQIRIKSRAGFSRRTLAAQLRCLACSDPEGREPAITAPTLVLAGEHDSLIPNYYARQMAQRIPGARFEVIGGAGHNPFAECPQRVLPIVIDFLREGHGTAFASVPLQEPHEVGAGGRDLF